MFVLSDERKCCSLMQMDALNLIVQTNLFRAMQSTASWNKMTSSFVLAWKLSNMDTKSSKERFRKYVLYFQKFSDVIKNIPVLELIHYLKAFYSIYSIKHNRKQKFCFLHNVSKQDNKKKVFTLKLSNTFQQDKMAITKTSVILQNGTKTKQSINGKQWYYFTIKLTGLSINQKGRKKGFNRSVNKIISGLAGWQTFVQVSTLQCLVKTFVQVTRGLHLWFIWLLCDCITL